MGSNGNGRSNAHRGDTRKRDDDVTCFNCGKKGHKSARCKVGARTGGDDLAKSVKDAQDKADGASIAAREFHQENKELREKLRQADQAAQKALEVEKELNLRNAALDKSVDKIIESLSEASSSTRRLTAEGWALIVAVCITVQVAVLATVEDCLVGRMIPRPWLIVAGASSAFAALVALLTCLYEGFTYGNDWHIRFVRNIPTPDLVDQRPDTNSLQQLKHRDPRLIEVKMREHTGFIHELFHALSGKRSKLIVSAELLAQLMSPRYQSLGLSEAQVWDRLLRGAETNQTVNSNRYLALQGTNVPMNTALVALNMWRHYSRSISEAGFSYPRDQ